jgi:hypothetical protein
MPMREYETKIRFQKCLAQWERAATSGERTAAETAARRIAIAHAIDPWSLGDEGLNGTGNFGRNDLLQTLRQEHRAKHPLNPGILVWEIDAAASIPEAVAYQAGDYTIVPSVIGASKWGSAYVVYAVYFGSADVQLRYRERLRREPFGSDGSNDCMKRAQRHYERQQKKGPLSRGVRL